MTQNTHLYRLLVIEIDFLLKLFLQKAGGRLLFHSSANSAHSTKAINSNCSTTTHVSDVILSKKYIPEISGWVDSIDARAAHWVAGNHEHGCKQHEFTLRKQTN